MTLLAALVPARARDAGPAGRGAARGRDAAATAARALRRRRSRCCSAWSALLLIVLRACSGGGDSQPALGMGVGALLVFVGVAMLARYVVRPLARVIGWPLERLAGTTGRLARENAMRNPAAPRAPRRR